MTNPVFLHSRELQMMRTGRGSTTKVVVLMPPKIGGGYNGNSGNNTGPTNYFQSIVNN